MTRLDEPLPLEARDAAEMIGQLPHVPNEESAYSTNEKYDKENSTSVSENGKLEYELDGTEVEYDANGKEKVLETAEDFSKTLVSLDDDPTLPIHTFRMWFTGLGLAVFGAVLGMLFQFRPQVITVSALFLQLLAYMIGRVLEAIIPGPGSRLHRNNWFWNFMNPGPFNLKEHVAAQIMANTAATAATACFVFASDDLFYGITVNVSLVRNDEPDLCN